MTTAKRKVIHTSTKIKKGKETIAVATVIEEDKNGKKYKRETTIVIGSISDLIKRFG